MSVEVRPLRPKDVDWLAELHNVAFADYAVPAVLDGAALQTYLEETDVDLSLSRLVPVGGRAAVELRAEAFNLLNTDNFGNPNGTFGTASFGTITTAFDPRVVQLAVKVRF